MDYQVLTNASTGKKTIVAFFPEENEPLVSATSDHPHFALIEQGLKAGLDSVYSLFDVANGANVKFETLGSRYSIRNGKLCRDLDPVPYEALANQVIRFIEEGVDDWQHLVKFLERVDSNPSEQSRADLCKWIAAGKLTLTPDGLCVGYKSFHKQNDELVSTYAGYAVVDGVEHDRTKKVPNRPESVVEMPRSMVDPNSAQHCSVGLHVGTYEYAKGYAGGNYVGEVWFDPADAVAVPTDDAGKIRVCRYQFKKLVDSAYTGPVLPVEDCWTQQEVDYYDDVDAPDNW